MADIKNNKLSAVPSPVPSSKSPLPPLDSEGNPVVDPDADMEDDPDVITKVCLNFSTKCLLKITILQHSKSYYCFIPHTMHPVKTKLENFKIEFADWEAAGHPDRWRCKHIYFGY